MRRFLGLRIGCGSPGVSAAPALVPSSSGTRHPNSGALASSGAHGHTGRPDKGGGEEKCHGCKKIAEEETDEGDVDGEDLQGEEGRNMFKNNDHLKRHEIQMAK